MNRRASGFTIAELLIVVAIIAVLVAIAVPAFSSNLEKANIAVDLASERIMKAYTASVRITGDLNVAGLDVPLTSLHNVMKFVYMEDGTLSDDIYSEVGVPPQLPEGAYYARADTDNHNKGDVLVLIVTPKVADSIEYIWDSSS